MIGLFVNNTFLSPESRLFDLMTQSTHFIYRYMFNNHTDKERGNQARGDSTFTCPNTFIYLLIIDLKKLNLITNLTVGFQSPIVIFSCQGRRLSLNPFLAVFVSI